MRQGNTLIPILAILLWSAGMATPEPVLHGNARALADSCIAEGEDGVLCECYAGFVAENTSDRELEALTILTDPKYRGSMQDILKALTAKGLKPNEILAMAMRADALQGKAKARCEPDAGQR